MKSKCLEQIITGINKRLNAGVEEPQSDKELANWTYHCVTTNLQALLENAAPLCLYGKINVYNFETLAYIFHALLEES